MQFERLEYDAFDLNNDLKLKEFMYSITQLHEYILFSGHVQEKHITENHFILNNNIQSIYTYNQHIKKIKIYKSMNDVIGYDINCKKLYNNKLYVIKQVNHWLLIQLIPNTYLQKILNINDNKPFKYYQFWTPIYNETNPSEIYLKLDQIIDIDEEEEEVENKKKKFKVNSSTKTIIINNN